MASDGELRASTVHRDGGDRTIIRQQWLCRDRSPVSLRAGTYACGPLLACRPEREVHSAPRSHAHARRSRSETEVTEMTDAEKTVLLIEDNEDNRTVYRTILEHFGYRVIEGR